MSKLNLCQPGLHSTRVPVRSILPRQAVSLRSQLHSRKQNSTVSSAAAIDAPTSASVTSMGAEELQARVDAFLAGYRNSQHIEHAYWVEESMVSINTSYSARHPVQQSRASACLLPGAMQACNAGCPAARAAPIQCRACDEGDANKINIQMLVRRSRAPFQRSLRALCCATALDSSRSAPSASRSPSMATAW